MEHHSSFLQLDGCTMATALWHREREGLLARASGVDGILLHQRFMEWFVANSAWRCTGRQWPEATLIATCILQHRGPTSTEIRYGTHEWVLRVLDYPGHVDIMSFDGHLLRMPRTSQRRMHLIAFRVNMTTRPRSGSPLNGDAMLRHLLRWGLLSW